MSKARTHFGEMLALYRAAHHWSLRDVAPMIGIGHATLMRIEHGQPMDAATLLKLMTWLLADTSPTS